MVSLIGILFSTASAAGQIPGNINFSLDASPNHHTYKFRLIVNDTVITFPTGCVSPATGFAQALTYGAIGQPQAILTIQAADCTQKYDHWTTLNGYFEYNSQYWYDLYINMVDQSFYF